MLPDNGRKKLVMLPFLRGRFPPDRTGPAAAGGALFAATLLLLLLLVGVDTKDESWVWRCGRGRDGVASAGVGVTFCFFVEGCASVDSDGNSDAGAELGCTMLAVEGLRNMMLSFLL